MKTELFFNAETILAFRLKGGNSHQLECLGEHKIGEYTYDLFSPTDEDGNPTEGEYTDGAGNGVGLTTAEERTGIGTIDIDGLYNTIYTSKLGDISYTDDEALAIVGNADPFTSKQGILYFIEGETRENALAILDELGVDPEEFLPEDEDC